MDPNHPQDASPEGPGSGYAEDDATVIGAQSSITPHNYPTGLTARELAHALRGEMLGHFLLQEYIGGGGMGVVFKALDTTLDRIVAVKVVASHHVAGDDLQRRFLVEAQSTARLDHPNIARVHYIGRDRGLPYIVFEYIEGMNVRDLVNRQGPLPVAEAVGYAYQIAGALAHAWQRDVVHRDIKPSNILITPDGQAKLVDMGLARLKTLDEEHPDDALTATGITLGTFDYISPEQARDPRLADTRSDIYSLGCTLFYMLTGQAPFAGGTAIQKLLDHQGERPPDLRTFRSDIPDSVSLVVRQMLAKPPGDRQQTPVVLAVELAEILQELDAPLPQGAAPLAWNGAELLPPRRQSASAWMTPIVAMVCIGLMLDQWWRDDQTVAAFPALRQAPPAAAAYESPEPTPPTDEPAIRTSPAPSGAPPQEEVAADRDLPPDAGTPALSIGEQLDAGASLWDAFSKWPVPPPHAALGATMADEYFELPAGQSPRQQAEADTAAQEFELLPRLKTNGRSANGPSSTLAPFPHGR